MGIFKKSQSSEVALQNYRRGRETERRQALKHHLRMESLESRKVFAGLVPVAVNDFYEATIDEALQVETSGVLANDVLTGDSLTANEFTVPQHGELNFNPDGTFSYQPDPGFVGMDGFMYQVDDGGSQSQFAAVTIEVTDPNVAPVGGNDLYVLEEDSVLTLLAEDGVLANDFDANGDALVVEIVDPTESGTVELEEDGSFIYTPAPDFYGTDAFTYQISDGAKQSDLVVVELTVTPMADAPQATGESFSMQEDAVLEIASDAILSNDIDADSDTTLAIVLESQPENGTLEVMDDGGFRYTPAADFHGTDRFTYRVSDGELFSDIVEAEIVIEAVNDAPVATDDSIETDEGAAIIFAADSLLANDTDLEGDALAAEIAQAPENGSLEVDTDGNWVYTPEEGFFGTDEFSYYAMDGSDSDMATVSVLVNEVIEDPVAVNESYQATAGETLVVETPEGLLANDIEDPSNAEPMQVEVFRGPKHGELQMSEDGSFQYTPDADYTGTDSILYRATEGDLQSQLAVATLYVNAPTPEPVDVGIAAEDLSPTGENVLPEDPCADPSGAAEPVADEPVGSALTEDSVTESGQVDSAPEASAEGDSVADELAETGEQEEQNPWIAIFTELDDFWFEFTCFLS